MECPDDSYSDEEIIDFLADVAEKIYGKFEDRTTDRDWIEYLLERLNDQLDGDDPSIDITKEAAIGILCAICNLLDFRGSIDALKKSQTTLEAARRYYRTSDEPNSDKKLRMAAKIAGFYKSKKERKNEAYKSELEKQDAFQKYYKWYFAIANSPAIRDLPRLAKKKLLVLYKRRLLERTAKLLGNKTPEATHEILRIQRRYNIELDFRHSYFKYTREAVEQKYADILPSLER